MDMQPRARRVAGLGAVMGALLIGCATPQPVVRLYPDGKDVVWRAGRGMLAQEKAGFRVAAAFDHQRDDLVAFRVEIENRSSDRVEIDHHVISYVVCNAANVCPTRYAVVDPEKAMVDMDLARAREHADKENDQAASAGLALLDVIGAVAGVASGDHRGAADSASLATNMASRGVEDGIAHDQTIGMIDSAQREWAVVALRRTTLFPSQAVGGDVFIPIDAAASMIWLRVDIGPTTFWFPFRQVVQVAR
jgi:hypothetical protein